MKTDFVIVTSLFNLSQLKRDDNRDWNSYLEWFAKTLQVKCPFIVFTEPNLSDFVTQQRGDKLTYIVEQQLTQIPLYHLKEPVQEILDSVEYKAKMSDTSRVECKDSMYLAIQYSKFKWLKQATQINPFNSKYFFWLDAGASRFIDESEMQNTYPSSQALNQLARVDNTFVIQYNHEYYHDLVNSNRLSPEYLWDNRSFTCGSMFGGNRQAIAAIDVEIDITLNYMLKEHCVNNEQIALGYLCKNKPEFFTKHHRSNPGKHLTLFQEMV